MGSPVYKLYFYKPSLALLEMAHDQLAAYVKKTEEFLSDAGGRLLIQGSVWSTERFAGFGVEWFPSWKALREHDRCLDEMHWFQYMDSETYLGFDPADEPNRLEPLNLLTDVDYIAHIYISRSEPPIYSVSEAETAEAMKVFDLGKALGVVPVVHGYSRPIDEEWSDWGVELYPSLEALETKTKAQEKVNWWKYITAKTYLGTAYAGELLGK